jgi:signal transduction histidine kinase
VRVSDRDGDLAVMVRDDGAGFDPSARSAGFGLLGMRERLALVHGTLTIESAPGAGTLVRAAIPVRRRAPERAA